MTCPAELAALGVDDELSQMRAERLFEAEVVVAVDAGVPQVLVVLGGDGLDADGLKRANVCGDGGLRVGEGRPGPSRWVPGALHRFALQWLMLAVAIIGLAGCGSLVNPHLRFDDQLRPMESVVPIDEAIDYADHVKDQYRKAIGDDAMFSRLLGAGLIGTATALPIMALNEVSKKSLGIVGMYGAGVYALDAWLQSEPRRRAYIQGYNAVNCAVAVVLPLAFDQNQEPYNSFDKAVKELPGNMQDLEEQLLMLESSLLTLENLPLAAEIKAEIKQLRQKMVASRAALEEAETARRKGIEVQLRIAAAGRRLIGTVDRIIGEVDTAILANASDLSTLSGIIGRLGSIYGEFPGAPAVSMLSPGLSSTKIALNSITVFNDDIAETIAAVNDDFAEKTAAVTLNTLIISDFVASLSVVQPVETLKSCRVDPETITTAMSIQPDSARFSGTRDETRPFLVRGGASQYMMSVQGTDSNLISVDQPVPFGPSFTVIVKSGAPPGLYSIHVVDRFGRTTSLPLEVAGGE